jgi:hypothetical protein
MKTKFLLMVFILGLAGMTSCTKKDSDTPSPATPGVPKIKTATEYYGTYEYSTAYRYDAAGRLTGGTYSDSGYFHVVYGTGTVEINEYSSAGIMQYKTVYTLNSSGLAVSATGTDYYKGGVNRFRSLWCRNILKTISSKTDSSVSSTVTYEYDIEGYLIRETYYETYDTTVFTYVVENGNTVSMSYIIYDIPMTFYYQYLTDKTNTIGEQNMGITFLGKQDKNLIQSIQYIYDTIAVSYEFDSKSRVSKRSIVGENDYYTFTYTD